MVCLVYLVHLVCLVYLVSFVQPNKQDKLNKPNKRDKQRDQINKTGEGSRSEVQGFRNFEPRTSGRTLSAAPRLTLVSRLTSHASCSALLNRGLTRLPSKVRGDLNVEGQRLVLLGA